MTKTEKVYYGENDPRNVYETRPMMHDDDIGGCPSFEPNQEKVV